MTEREMADAVQGAVAGEWQCAACKGWKADAPMSAKQPVDTGGVWGPWCTECLHAYVEWVDVASFPENMDDLTFDERIRIFMDERVREFMKAKAELRKSAGWQIAS